MPAKTSAMLFAPPQPPVRLVRSRTAVIGRSRRCDLTLASGAASRRHAEVRFDQGRFVVADLGSTNGTYVNGERLTGERVLSPGDRIDVGGSLVTFCQVEGEIGDPTPSEGQTQLRSLPLPVQTTDVFRGELAEIPAFAVLQVLEMGGKTGVLTVVGDDGDARLWVANGAPVHAESPKQSGLEAAFELARWERGRFGFEPGAVAPRQSIDANVTEILLEASRRRDEEENGAT